MITDQNPIAAAIVHGPNGTGAPDKSHRLSALGTLNQFAIRLAVHHLANLNGCPARRTTNGVRPPHYPAPITVQA